MERRWMERENKIFIINDSTLHLYVWSHIDTFYVFLRLFTLGTNIGFCLFPYLTALGLHSCTQRLSLATVSGYSLVSVLGLLNAGASHCGEWALGSTGSVMWYTGLAALQRVGSSWTRDQIHVPCIVMQIPTQGTTREVPNINF